MNFSSAGPSQGDVIHLALNAILDGCGIVCNLILITAIMKSTPPILKNYSILLLFTASTDCWAAFMSLMSTAIVETIDGAIIYIHIGPCRLIHQNIFNAAIAFYMQTIPQSCVLLLISFSYRLICFNSTLICGPRTDIRLKLLFICTISTIPAVIGLIANCFPSPPKISLLEHPDLVGRYFSVYNLTAESQLSWENGLPRATIFYIEALFLVATPILFVLRRKLVRKIRTLAASSERIRHQMILRSLTIQMCLPFSFSFPFIFWILDFLGIYRLEILQRSIVPMASIFAVVSPIKTIYYLPPYRKIFVNLVPHGNKSHSVHVLPSNGVIISDKNSLTKR